MNKIFKNRRWRVIADFKLQGALLARMAIYWVGCQLAIVCTIAAFTLLLDSPEPGGKAEIGRFLFPAVIVSSLVLPLVLLDLAIFSNKFAGPMHQFRTKLKRMAESGEVQRIEFRKGDYYPEIRDYFNQVSLKLAESSESKFQETVVNDDHNTPVGV